MPEHSFAALFFSLCLITSVSHAQETNWRDQVGTFKIGLVVRPGQRSPDRVLISETFSKQLGMPVEVVISKDYLTLIDAQASGRVDYAVYSSLAYAASVRFCECILPLVQPLATSTSSADVELSGQRIIVQKRRGDHAGKRRLVVAKDDQTLQSWDIVAREHGFPVDVELVHATSQEEARKLFRAGAVDMILDWEMVWVDGSGVTISDTRDQDVIRTIWKSDMVLPLGVHALRRSVPAQAKSLLQALMTDGAPSHLEMFMQLEPVHHAGFVHANETHVASAIAALNGWIDATD